MPPIGQLVRRARLKAGFTQQQLAERIGRKNRQQVYDIEKGNRDPTTATLQKIAKACGMTVSQLTKGLK